MNDASFTTRALQVKSLIQGRKFGQAAKAAHELANDFKGESEAIFLLNLACCLCNNVIPDLVQQAEALRASELMIGDMLRDQALCHIRLGAFSEAQELIGFAREQHVNDPNRLACLVGAEGRLAYARRNFELACAKHKEANNLWAALVDPNHVWMYNNYVHWLKAIVKSDGITSPQAKMIHGWIRTRCPEGMKNRGREAWIIMLPCGNQLHDRALRARRT